MYDGVINLGVNIEKNFKAGTFDKIIMKGFNKSTSTYKNLIRNPYNQTWYLRDRLIEGGF